MIKETIPVNFEGNLVIFRSMKHAVCVPRTLSQDYHYLFDSTFKPCGAHFSMFVVIFPAFAPLTSQAVLTSNLSTKHSHSSP